MVLKGMVYNLQEQNKQKQQLHELGDQQKPDQ